MVLAGPDVDACVLTSEAILVIASFCFMKAARSFLDIFDLLANPIPPKRDPDFDDAVSEV